MILSTSRIKCHQAKNSISSGSWSNTQNDGQNRIYPSLTLLTAKCFPLKRVLKKSYQKSDKVLQKNKQTNNHFFLPKINNVFLSPILRNLKGMSILDIFFLKIILSSSRKRCHQAKILSFQEICQKRKMVIQIEFTHSQTANIFPFKRVFKKLLAGIVGRRRRDLLKYFVQKMYSITR